MTSFHVPVDLCDSDNDSPPRPSTEIRKTLPLHRIDSNGVIEIFDGDDDKEDAWTTSRRPACSVANNHRHCTNESNKTTKVPCGDKRLLSSSRALNRKHDDGYVAIEILDDDEICKRPNNETTDLRDRRRFAQRDANENTSTLPNSIDKPLVPTLSGYDPLRCMENNKAVMEVVPAEKVHKGGGNGMRPVATCGDVVPKSPNPDCRSGSDGDDVIEIPDSDDDSFHTAASVEDKENEPSRQPPKTASHPTQQKGVMQATTRDVSLLKSVVCKIEFHPEESPPSDGDSEDCAILGRTHANSISDFPHAREQCVVHPQAVDPNKHCEKCYCFVCDIPVGDCTEWSKHCHARYSDRRWRRERDKKKSSFNNNNTQQLVS